MMKWLWDIRMTLLKKIFFSFLDKKRYDSIFWNLANFVAISLNSDKNS